MQGVDKGKAEEMMERMRAGAAKQEFDSATSRAHQFTTDDFTYTDPVDGNVSPKQVSVKSDQKSTEDFTYTDPVDGSVSPKQVSVKMTERAPSR